MVYAFAFVPVKPSGSRGPLRRRHLIPRRSGSQRSKGSSASTAPSCDLTSPQSSISECTVPAILQHASVVPPHAASYFKLRRPYPPFFEGWYLRLTLPSSSLSYAFMFSVESAGPATAQLLSADDQLHVCQLSQDCKPFYSARKRLAIGHWGYVPPSADSPRQGLDEAVVQGYHLSGVGSHGRFTSSNGETPVQWAVEFEPTVAWGRRGDACCTATWLSRMPMFDPGYQVLMARGVVSEGYVSVGEERVPVDGAVVYCEKNWGSSFPRRWWWIQAGVFDEEEDLTLTAVGSTRMTVGVEEMIGLVAVHFKGRFFEFSNWNCTSLTWRVSEWGRWEVEAVSRSGHSVSLTATTMEGSVGVLGPSSGGMQFNVRDCARGRLSVTLRGRDGKRILDAVQSECAQVENGGERWEGVWEECVRPMRQPLRALVNAFDRGAENAA